MCVQACDSHSSCQVLFANIKKKGGGEEPQRRTACYQSSLLLMCSAGRFVGRGLMRSLFTVLKLEQIRGSFRKQISLQRILSFIDTPETLDFFFFCEMLDASWVTKAWAQMRKWRQSTKKASKSGKVHTNCSQAKSLALILKDYFIFTSWYHWASREIGWKESRNGGYGNEIGN